MKKYDILIAKLYACCGNQEEFPREPITIDTNKMSELLEGVFIKAGLLNPCGIVVKQYRPTACGQQTMIKCNDGRLFHAPTSDFRKIR